MQSESPPSSVLILDIWPQIDCGRYPVKREVGDTLEIWADIFKDGHDKIGAVVEYRAWDEEEWQSAPIRFYDNDRWHGRFDLTRNTRYHYRVVGYADRLATWLDELEKKHRAGLNLTLELEEGRLLLERMASASPAAERAVCPVIDAILGAPDQEAAVAHILAPATVEAIKPWVLRDGAATSQELTVIVDRVRARFAAWYELFPRSAGAVPGQSGTFRDVIGRLDHIKEMGFDVVYLTPVHPIGRINRKGKNNTLVAAEDDPGVPYAIGNELGGHDAIEPSLGTEEDFAALVAEAARRDMEVALDIAFQAAPDHPWATEHPDWFTIRPDGSIKFAENPPKKYEDIYPINFDTPAWRELWEELKRIILVWVERGVRTFRVDNPHTKPVVFWEWLIEEVHRHYPDVIFLSEAFTRPKMMRALAKAGFAQSYTYFTWRNHKQEIIDYFVELTQSDAKEYMRGNLFPNTHDILPYFLQGGGRPAFRIRLALAATLSSVYGIYSSFELCENTPVPGREEYLNSEKYELKVWDWERPGNIIEDVRCVNAARRVHPALQEYDNLRFYWADDDRVLCYAKRTHDLSDRVLVVCSLDPHNVVESWIHLDLYDLGLPEERPFRVTNLFNGDRWEWTGAHHSLRLDPHDAPYLLLHLEPA
jgi:starch synthase (maltosyl-transferring)